MTILSSSTISLNIMSDDRSKFFFCFYLYRVFLRLVKMIINDPCLTGSIIILAIQSLQVVDRCTVPVTGQ